MKSLFTCFVFALCLLVQNTTVAASPENGKEYDTMEHGTTDAHKVVSFELSYKGSGMRPYTKYKYHLREQDGRVLFDANLYVGRKFAEIILENAVISREDIDAVLEICGGISTIAELRNVEKNPSPVMNDPRTDGPHHNEILEVMWEDGAGMVKAPPDNRKKILLNYLQMLAIRLALPPAEGNIFAFTYHGRNKWGNYHYDLAERKDTIAFHAVYQDKHGRKELKPTSARREDMQALQEICDRYALAEAQQRYRPSIRPDFEPDLGKRYVNDYTYIAVTWENGAVLNADTTFIDEEILKAFFLELAVRLANQKTTEK